jgi:predicted ATP-grasp superfamily ATP-dependent carboligase
MSTVEQSENPVVLRGLTEADLCRRKINEMSQKIAEVIDRKGARNVPRLAAAEKALREAAFQLYASSSEWDRRDVLTMDQMD